MVYLTFSFPVNSLSDALIEAGRSYAAMVQAPAQKGKKSSQPPCAYKLYSLIVAMVDLGVNNKDNIEKTTAKRSGLKQAYDDAYGAIVKHSEEVTSIEKLDATQMHAESRITFDEQSCIVILMSHAYPMMHLRFRRRAVQLARRRRSERL